MTRRLQHTCEVLESQCANLQITFGAPWGLASLLHKLLQLNTSYSPAFSFPLWLSVLLFGFHFASADSPGTFSTLALFFFKLVFLSSHSFFCFPLTVSQAESQPDASPAPAVQAFHKTWQEEDGEPGLRKKKWIRALEVCWNWQNTLD